MIRFYAILASILILAIAVATAVALLILPFGQGGKH